MKIHDRFSKIDSKQRKLAFKQAQVKGLEKYHLNSLKSEIDERRLIEYALYKSRVEAGQLNLLQENDFNVKEQSFYDRFARGEVL